MRCSELLLLLVFPLFASVNCDFFENFSENLKGERGEVGPPGPPGPKGECVERPVGPLSDSWFKYDTSIADDSASQCQCNISEILNVVDVSSRRGEDGVPGPKGDKGDAGRDGRDGQDGRTGLPGPPGPPGPPASNSKFDRDLYSAVNQFADTNTFGMSVSQGPAGRPGPRGERGPPGARGDAGPIGPPGSTSVVKADGETLIVLGEKGQKGERGRRGKRGETGSSGEQGPAGPPGKSPLPEDFLRSIPGLKGEKGAQGERGEPGKASSIEGPPGPPGPPGAAGAAAAATTVVFSDVNRMMAASASHAPGTIAYLEEEDILLLRVKIGWQYLSLGSVVQIPSKQVASTAGPDDGQKGKRVPDVDSPIRSQKKLRLVALNKAFSGDAHGIRGADYECHRQSRKANMVGSFRAFLSGRDQNLESIVRSKDSHLPLVNTKGDILFNSWRDIISGSGAAFSVPPRIYSFDGRNVLQDSSWPHKSVWHGADRHGIRQNEGYCDAWNTNSRHRSGLASNILRGKLLDQEKHPCNSQLILLCVEINAVDDNNWSARSKRSHRNVRNITSALSSPMHS